MGVGGDYSFATSNDSPRRREGTETARRGRERRGVAGVADWAGLADGEVGASASTGFSLLLRRFARRDWRRGRRQGDFFGEAPVFVEEAGYRGLRHSGSVLDFQDGEIAQAGREVVAGRVVAVFDRQAAVQHYVLRGVQRIRIDHRREVGVRGEGLV